MLAMTGLYHQPQSGTILHDGQPIAAGRGRLSQTVSAVFTDVWLFDRCWGTRETRQFRAVVEK